MEKVNRWINDNYERLYENACKIIPNRDKAGDCLHLCILSLLEYSAEKQQKLYEGGKLENYITMCVNTQYKSSTSPYYTKHRKQSMMETEYVEWKHYDVMEEEVDEYQQVCDCIFSSIDELHFYYRALLNDKFIEGLTYAQMNEKYRISKNSLLKDVKVGVEMLKQKCVKNGK